jgi:hypothetical protein
MSDTEEREKELVAELKVIRKAKAKVAREATKEIRAQQRAERSSVVANNVAMVVKDKPWPAFASFDDFAQAAYDSALTNGAKDDPFFTDEAKGLIRFKRAVRSQGVKALLPEQGILLYVTKKAVGVPDTETVKAMREQSERRIVSAITNENEKREQARAIAGVELPKMEVHLLSA